MNNMKHKPDVEWFAHARIGLFTHYTYGTRKGKNSGTLRSANDARFISSPEEAAACLDARKFAEAAHDMGAEYVVFTVCHAGFNILFPSETMKRAGMPQKCSQTDAVQPLLDELDKYGIPLVLYMPPNDTHDLSDEELAVLRWDDKDVLEVFINEFLCEIGERYNGRIAGFWFDQGGPRISARECVLKYNPNAVIYINTGKTANEKLNSFSDLIVSEYYGTFAAGSSSDAEPVHHSQINRIFGGSWWACGGKALSSPEALYRYMVRTISVEGQLNSGVNYAAGQYLDQTWEEGVREAMHEFGELVRKNSYAIYGTVPGKSFVTRSGSVLDAADHFVSTESHDSSRVYLHVLNLPESGVLELPEASDGRIFVTAYSGSPENGIKLPFDGKRIVLPEVCDKTDTVITLM